MAYNFKPRIGRPKRLSYVEDSETSSCQSSDDENLLSVNPKVRNELSIRCLLKDGESEQKDEDHIYSKTGEYMFGKKDEQLKVGDNLETLCRQNSRNRRAPMKRKRSSDVDYCEGVSSKRQKCFSKNAVMARLNRERKKIYIQSLEEKNKELEMSNEVIKKKLNKQEKVLGTLMSQVKYYKSLLANSKEISQIITAIQGSTGLKVTSSCIPETVSQGKSGASPEQGYASDTDNTSRKVHQPRVKTVTSGRNYPIFANDVNLGSFPCINDDDDSFLFPENSQSASPLLSFEEEFSCNDLFDFNIKENEIIPETIENIGTTPGICLHVNNKKVSVEFCSLCSSKAFSTWDNP